MVLQQLHKSRLLAAAVLIWSVYGCATGGNRQRAPEDTVIFQNITEQGTNVWLQIGDVTTAGHRLGYVASGEIRAFPVPHWAPRMHLEGYRVIAIQVGGGSPFSSSGEVRSDLEMRTDRIWQFTGRSIVSMRLPRS